MCPTLIFSLLASVLITYVQLRLSAHPAPLRMLAADALLIEDPYPPAIETLRDVARMPNREIALLVAQIVQRRLGVDLGMNLNHPPDLHTRQAAEVTRRVIQWATEEPADERLSEDDETP